MVSRIWFNLFSITATVSLSTETSFSGSIAERKESTDDERVGEGGVRDSDCSESVEPGVRAVNWTMVQDGVPDQPSWEIFS
jgi:hypothetical protein